MIEKVFPRLTGFLVFAALLLGLGLILVSRLPIMMYPPTERPVVRINISHPGVSAIDFQDNYADYFEPYLLGLSLLDIIESRYGADRSSFTLIFDWDMNADEAISETESLMNAINSRLPQEMEDSYRVYSRTDENAGYLVIGIASPSTPPEELYKQLDQNLAPRLNSIADAEETAIYNFEALRIDIVLDHYKMLSYGMTIGEVDTVLRDRISPYPLGSLSEDGKKYSVRYSRNAKKINDLERLVVKEIEGRSVTLAEIAVISITYELPGDLFLVDGSSVIQLSATPKDGGNITRMTRDIQNTIQTVRAENLIPSDTEFTLFIDPAKYIQKSINNVIGSALIGGSLAILIVLLILGEAKNTLIIGLSLPCAIILSFNLMSAFGVSLNLISLGGIALGVGMIIDSTIVVMENIHRHRLESRSALSRVEWKVMVIAAAEQVRSPVIASTLTSVLVFLPITYTAPLTNAILGDQAKTVIFALLCSLFVALFLVPIIAYLLYRPSGKSRSSYGAQPRGLPGISPVIVGKVTGAYQRVLAKILRRKALAIVVILGAFSLLAVSVVFILPEIPREIISPPASDRVVVFFRNTVDYPDSKSMMEAALPDIEQRIDKRLGDLIVLRYTNVRRWGNLIFVDLISSDYADYAIKELQKEFPTDGNNYFNVFSWDPAELPLPRTASLKITVYGPDEFQKIALLQQMRDIIAETEIYNRVYSDPNPAFADEINLALRTGVLDGFPGLTESGLNQQVRQILQGTSTITIAHQGSDVEVGAHFPEEKIDSRDKLRNFLIPWNNQYIPLKHFYEFAEQSRVSEIYAVNGEPAYSVMGRIRDNLSDSKRLEYEQRIQALFDAELELPKGYSYVFENPRQELEASIQSLFLALGISIVLIYLLLCFQFNSLWIPLVILVSVPLGFIGVIVSLKLFNSTISLNSMLGTILLGGVVVNNSILIIDFWLKGRFRHLNPVEALQQVAALRFQPILITTFTTILGMLPIALGIGEGSNILQPLGIAVSGGLFISTAFTLFIVPSLLSLFVASQKKQEEEI